MFGSHVSGFSPGRTECCSQYDNYCCKPECAFHDVTFTLFLIISPIEIHKAHQFHKKIKNNFSYAEAVISNFINTES